MSDCCEKMNHIEEELCDIVDSAMADDVELIDGEELGAVIDMIKDISEAQLNYWQARYYKSLVENGSHNNPVHQ